jgi:hypothetical protein
MEKKVFKNLAWKGIRLSYSFGEIEGLNHIEIGTHRTALDGDFYIETFIKKGKDTWGKIEVFPSFEGVITRIEELIGETNIREFKELAEQEQKEMLENKYVREWKGLNKIFRGVA